MERFGLTESVAILRADHVGVGVLQGYVAVSIAEGRVGNIPAAFLCGFSPGSPDGFIKCYLST